MMMAARVAGWTISLRLSKLAKSYVGESMASFAMKAPHVVDERRPIHRIGMVEVQLNSFLAR
jgi:hypothetical protein